MALFRTLPTPTNYFLPSLMVEVCLVLAPAVNFFLNSRKQGLPCWRSLTFFLSAEAPYILLALPSQTVFNILISKAQQTMPFHLRHHNDYAVTPSRQSCVMTVGLHARWEEGRYCAAMTLHSN